MRYKDFIIRQIKEWLSELDKEQQDFHPFLCFGVLPEDFINNSSCTFNIEAGITCSFKCNKECGREVCQNSILNENPIIATSVERLVDMYNNSISDSITMQGLEPLDSIGQVLWFIRIFREKSNDPIYIWTGYTEEECEALVSLIKEFGWKNIIIKYGRYIPDSKGRYDEVVGVYLASDNQYAIKYNGE